MTTKPNFDGSDKTRQEAEALTDQIRDAMRQLDEHSTALESSGFGQPEASEQLALLMKVHQLYDPDMFADIKLATVKPFTIDEAEILDDILIEHVDDAAYKLNDLAALVSYAKAGLIHEALKYSSWTAYIRQRLEPLQLKSNPVEAREIAVELHRQGMSIRDAAVATGLSKSAVGRAVSQSGTPETRADETTDQNGRVQTRDRQKPDKTPRGKFSAAIEKLGSATERLSESLGYVVRTFEGLSPEDVASSIEDLRQSHFVLEKQCELISQVIERLGSLR